MPLERVIAGSKARLISELFSNSAFKKRLTAALSVVYHLVHSLAKYGKVQLLLLATVIT